MRSKCGWEFHENLNNWKSHFLDLAKFKADRFSSNFMGVTIGDPEGDLEKLGIAKITTWVVLR
jgi:hypothetical protein